MYVRCADRYVQETQKLSNEEIPLQKPSYYSTLDTMHMDDTVRNHLEVIFQMNVQVFFLFEDRVRSGICSFRAHGIIKCVPDRVLLGSCTFYCHSC